MVGTQLAVILQECYQLAGAEAALPLPAAAWRQPPNLNQAVIVLFWVSQIHEEACCSQVGRNSWRH